MTWRGAALVVVICTLYTAGLAAVCFVTPARADTPSTCTTDTPSSYCESIDQGAQGDPAIGGFAMVETVLGTIVGLFFGAWVLKKLLAQAGWWSW